MQRRNLIGGFITLGACAICARPGFADEGVHWSYQGKSGPEHWGALDGANAACSAGAQQSPLNLTGAIKADIPQIGIDWKAGGGTIVNNGHTIQINVPEGSTLTRGGRTFDLLQYHFHAPSEHLVEGKTFPMEVHFVHKNRESGGLGVLGVFLTPGAKNEALASLAAAFQAEAGGVALVEDVDPNGLLPASLDYWSYEGSLTTPPCSEIVDWMVAREPLQVGAADIEKFTALYPMNARPALAPNRRFILTTS
ncbi:carbonate dehydratase [Mesorhizobium tianshanense]|uniref:Carbonic anhydrase n=1 Tax=Mesorhizobium tianshanense TaxID=39844 RepID=A0A562MSC6_9HYPH|nr:carbonic anhydrase [Mesorhizobium tianshanense]TWI22834.1 carbonic anhydrase [Mesorhizobium tianshanense]GLS35506.1 carbonate dehydratase [Mesorhizobium tianshanense]